MAMNYTTLTGAKSLDGSIKNWVNNEAFSSTTVLEEAEAWIWNRLRVREMLTALDAVMTIGVGGATITLPSDFMAMVWLGYRGQWTGKIRAVPIDELQDARQYDSSAGYALAQGQPFVYSLRGTVIEMPRAPDQAYTFREVYHARQAALSDSNQTNWLTVKAPRLIRQTCCAFAYEFMKNTDEKTYWLGMAQASVDELNAESDAEMGGLIADMVAV